MPKTFNDLPSLEVFLLILYNNFQINATRFPLKNEKTSLINHRKVESESGSTKFIKFFLLWKKEADPKPDKIR